ncbi:MAG: hypothetical protein RQ753_01805 [Desulfurivibrionaceae bacterium]|nr:hypothetical protein [Desulfobulbales bacterium]MDT8334410.1 hypothetical protein [Desulfurivibrionaceae bacterium]
MNAITPDTEIDRVLTAPGLQRVGIVGVPPLRLIDILHRRGVEILDLDAMLVVEDMESTVALLPRVYCAILRTVVLNAMHLDLDAIVLDVGPGKCDGALHVAAVLEDSLPIPILRVINNDRQPFGAPLCRAEMDMTDKFLAITERVKSPEILKNPPPPCRPTAGFWGVPPRDFSILALFPDTTHVYGWTRCMENKTPADAILEARINPAIPTVFFAQSFCAKTALARLLAKKHPHALYLDIDVNTGSSAKAKIQAFLDLSGVEI